MTGQGEARNRRREDPFAGWLAVMWPMNGGQIE
jgi:hypothetical protein